MKAKEWTDADWDKLIRGIRQGQVIPIVGERLSLADSAGLTRPYVSLLAEQLAADGLLEIDTLPDDPSLAVLTQAFIEQGGDLAELYDSLLSASLRIAAAPATPLAQLAEISDFRLFVTLSVDTLLEQALQAAHPADNVTQRAYRPREAQDIGPTWPPPQPEVYHLFGRISAMPDYVASQEDLLEFMHALQSDLSRPRELFARLSRCSLLIIGSAFSDWLVLFFLRMSSDERLSSRMSQFIIIDSELGTTAEMGTFVSHFSKRTRLVAQPADAFVTELHARWLAQRGDTLTAEADVFISYASEDRPLAEALRTSLLAYYPRLGIWLDQQGGLEVGDDYTRKIALQIRQARVFIPLITANSAGGEVKRFYRREWSWAEGRAIELGNLPFILPVCTATTLNDGQRSVPETFSKLHWQTFGDSPLGKDFADKVINTIRAHKKQVAA